MTKKQRKNGNKNYPAQLSDENIQKKQNKVNVLAELRGSLDDSSNVQRIEHEQGEVVLQKNRKKSHFLIGVFVLIMAVIGLISSITSLSKAIGDLADDASFKNQLAKYVFPLVVNDAPAFQTIDEMPESAIISCGVWNVLLSEDLSKYETIGENVIIPKVDVEYNINKLFGSSAKYEHKTVGDLFLQFEYLPEQNSYSAPKKPRYMLYSPYINDITAVGETYTVTVGYIPPSLVIVHGDEVEAEPEAEKYMEFTISISKEKKTIHALKYSEKNRELVLE